jgi:hypothetical protein
MRFSRARSPITDHPAANQKYRSRPEIASRPTQPVRFIFRIGPFARSWKPARRTIGSIPHGCQPQPAGVRSPLGLPGSPIVVLAEIVGCRGCRLPMPAGCRGYQRQSLPNAESAACRARLRSQCCVCRLPFGTTVTPFYRHLGRPCRRDASPVAGDVASHPVRHFRSVSPGWLPS